jgi:hypothetical protein
MTIVNAGGRGGRLFGATPSRAVAGATTHMTNIAGNGTYRHRNHFTGESRQGPP